MVSLDSTGYHLILNMQYSLTLSNYWYLHALLCWIYILRYYTHTYCIGKNAFVFREKYSVVLNVHLSLGLQKPILSLNLSWMSFLMSMLRSKCLRIIIRYFIIKPPQWTNVYISFFITTKYLVKFSQLSLAVHLQRAHHKFFLSQSSFYFILVNKTHCNKTYDA